MTTTHVAAPRTYADAPAWGSRLGADTRYVLTGVPRALVGVTLGPFRSRALADDERARIAEVLGEPVARPEYRAGRGRHRVPAAVTDPQVWRDLLHAVVRWAPSTIAFTVVVSWWVGVAGGLTWALWGWSLPDADREVPEMLGFGDAYMTTVGFYFALALLLGVTLPAVAQWAARFEARAAQRILNAQR